MMFDSVIGFYLTQQHVKHVNAIGKRQVGGEQGEEVVTESLILALGFSQLLPDIGFSD